MDDIAAQKQAVRSKAMAARNEAHKAAIGAGEAAKKQLLNWLETQSRFAVVSGYMPIRSELDIMPAMRTLHAGGTRICVPVIVGKGKPLRFREWHPDATLMRGPFGAMVPETGEWLRPDLLLCPMLAFDRAGQRMGYGGGFYDRSIAELRQEKPVTAVGYAYADQRVDELPCEATDEPLSGVITENGFFKPSRR